MYYSPIRVSGLNDEQLSNEAPSRAVLVAARRRLEAELMLTGTNTVTLAGAELNLQDIIALFDELADTRKFQFHLAVFKDQRLLHFLETGELKAAKYWRRNELYQQPDFVEFISPFYRQAVYTLCTNVLKGRMPIAALTALASNVSLLTAGDMEAAYRPANRHLQTKQAALAQLPASVRASAVSPDLTVITTQDIHILNTLPECYENLRTDIAILLVDISAAYYAKGLNRQALAAIVEAAAITLVNTTLAASIKEELKRMQMLSHQGFYYFNTAARRQVPGLPVGNTQEDIPHYKGTILKPISPRKGNLIMLFLMLAIVIASIVCSILGKQHKAAEHTVQVGNVHYRVPCVAAGVAGVRFGVAGPSSCLGLVQAATPDKSDRTPYQCRKEHLPYAILSKALRFIKTQ